MKELQMPFYKLVTLLNNYFSMSESFTLRDMITLLFTGHWGTKFKFFLCFYFYIAFICPLLTFVVPVCIISVLYRKYI